LPKCLSSRGLPALIRRGFPLADGSRRETETGFVFEASKGLPGLRLLEVGRVRFLV